MDAEPTQPRSILMTADTVGGVWTYAVELAAALEARGIEVFLAAMGGAPSELPECRVFAGGDFRLEWMEDPWDDVRRAGDWLLNLEATLSPDVIHLNQYAFGDLPWRAPVLMTGHSCVLSWWEAVHGLPAPVQWQTYAQRVRRGLQSAQVVTAPSGFMLGELVRYYGPLRESLVIPNARDSARFRPRRKEPFIFAAGRVWDEAKNLCALQALAPRLPWPVRIAGAGSDVGVLPETEVADLMSRAAIYALPARYEPFGLSVLEAALSGCALVLGDIASLWENWEGAALFVDPGDPEALEGALVRLIRDEGLRERLGLAARDRGLEFSPARMAGRYLEAYPGRPGRPPQAEGPPHADCLCEGGICV